MGGIFNIVVGLIMVGAGLSGSFSLLGTESPALLVGVGVVVVGFGVHRVIRDRRSKNDR